MINTYFQNQCPCYWGSHRVARTLERHVTVEMLYFFFQCFEHFNAFHITNPLICLLMLFNILALAGLQSGNELHSEQEYTNPIQSQVQLCVGCDASWCLLVQLAVGLKERLYLVEQMQDSMVTLIRHCAGSSATVDCYCFTAGMKGAIARVQGCLDMRTLTPKKMGETGSVTKVTEERGQG